MADYWALEGFDRESEHVVVDLGLTGRSNREWGDLFGRPDDDPLLGEWEVTCKQVGELERITGVTFDVHANIYFVGRRSDQ